MARAAAPRRPGGVVFTLVVCLLAGAALLAPQEARAIPTLTNDSGLHLDPGDSLFPHYNYKEKLKRGKVQRELLKETREEDPEDIEELIEQGIKDSSRTWFLSDNKHPIALPLNQNFSYFHQVPPAVNPDVTSSPQFNDFDFTQNLIEFELELDGKRSDSSSSFEVRLRQAGVDIASLGAIDFDHHNRFDFEFKQMVAFLGGSGIDPKIYEALADGILDVSIVRTSGYGNLFLFKSNLEVEIPQAPIPEPGTLLLLGSGLAGLAARGWRKRRKKREATKPSGAAGDGG